MPDPAPAPASGTARRTQAERRAETGGRLLDAAQRLIAAGGSGALSLQEVGREAGYSRGIVTHQFGSKEGLLRAVILDAQAAFAVPPTAATGLDLLLLTVETYLVQLQRLAPTGQALLLLWAEAVGSEPSLHSLFTERDAWFRQVLAGQVHNGISEGSIRPDADPPAVAVAILGMLRGVGLQLILTPGAAPPEQISSAIAATLRAGLAASPAAQNPRLPDAPHAKRVTPPASRGPQGLAWFVDSADDIAAMPPPSRAGLNRGTGQPAESADALPGSFRVTSGPSE